MARPPVRITKTVGLDTVSIPSIIKPIADRFSLLALTEVRAAWPTDTGKSKAGWTVATTITGHIVRITLTNTVGYAAYVDSKSGLTAQELCDAIIKGIQPAMNLEIEVAIADALSRA